MGIFEDGKQAEKLIDLGVDLGPKPARTLRREAKHAAHLATQYARQTVKDDGHWMGPMSSDVSITAEWIFLVQSIGLKLADSDREAYRFHFLSSQQPDGSWAIAPQYPYGGNLSNTIEAYLALKILGLSPSHPAMCKARSYVLAGGGAEKMRIFTRFHLAMFGLLPWSSVPQMPPELILLPSWFPINLYKFSSWSRITIVPFLIIRTHEPTYPLPNGLARNNSYLDELWLDPSNKAVPYAKDTLHLLRTNWIALFFQIADLFVWFFCILGLVPLRRWCLHLCANWLLDRQEASGDWAGIFPPMHLSLYALLLEGYHFDSEPIRLGLEALDRFRYQDEKHGLWMQPCVSPVWDTFLMVRGLLDADAVDRDDSLVANAVAWTRARQIFIEDGDWRVYRPKVSPGGFSFEYVNTIYPDVDDTAAGVLAFLTQDPSLVCASHVVRAAVWILGMQNADGGWAAFDAKNDALFLNSIPFSDMDALCDTSCPDIVGRVLEAFGLMLQLRAEQLNVQKLKQDAAATDMDGPLFDAIEAACRRGVAYLEETQESFGGWFGRWGTNYVYGTSNVLAGLAYFKARPRVRVMIPPAVAWLESVQNADGGWGEGLDSYVDISRAGKGESTPSQTAWALIGLLPYVNPTRKSIARGVEWLVTRQDEKTEDAQTGETVAATWTQDVHTGTGFPGHFYLGYDLYRHYFPLMALGRYVRAVDALEQDKWW